MILAAKSHGSSPCGGFQRAVSTRRGSALVIALFALTTVAAAGAVFLQITTSSVRRQAAEVVNTRAFCLGQAGPAADQGSRLVDADQAASTNPWNADR